MKRSKQDIEEFLNESLEFDSDTTELYDSDVDPEYLNNKIGFLIISILVYL